MRYRVILSNLCLGFAIIAQTILHPKRLSDSDPMYRREPKELLFNMSKQSTCDTLQRYDDLALTYPLTRHFIDNPVDDIDLFLYPTSGGGTPFQLI